ncbi:exported protein of unknown function [Microbacterium sp. Nx66]|nr:exported protein of unknown function [Microbacterium sp. Nx66]
MGGCSRMASPSPSSITMASSISCSILSVRTAPLTTGAQSPERPLAQSYPRSIEGIRGAASLA